MKHEEYQYLRRKLENKEKILAKETNEAILMARSYYGGFADGLQYALKHITEDPPHDGEKEYESGNKNC